MSTFLSVALYAIAAVLTLAAGGFAAVTVLAFRDEDAPLSWLFAACFAVAAGTAAVLILAAGDLK